MACAKTIFVRFGMAADEVLEAGRRTERKLRNRWRRRSGDEAAELGVLGEDGGQAGQHAMGGFADGKDAEVGKLEEVVVAAGAAKGVGGAGEAAFDGGAGVDSFQGTEEDAAREVLGVEGVTGVPVWHGRSIGRDEDDRARGVPELFLVNYNCPPLPLFL